MNTREKLRILQDAAINALNELSCAIAYDRDEEPDSDKVLVDVMTKTGVAYGQLSQAMSIVGVE